MSKPEVRHDPYLALLQRQIHDAQTQRTDALNAIERHKTEVARLDAELVLMTAERDARVTGKRSLPSIPDFPPVADEVSRTHAHPELMGIPNKSKRYKQITLRLVRDYVTHLDGWWKTGDIYEELRLPQSVVKNRCKELHELGVLDHMGNRASSRYRYNATVPKAPPRKPRGEEHVPGVGAESKADPTARARKRTKRSGNNKGNRKAAARGDKIVTRK
jgi:hypothetical protein